MKKINMKKQILKSFVMMLSLGLGFASANSTLDEQKELDERVETLQSRSGLEVFGVINGEFMQSDLSGAGNLGEDPSTVTTINTRNEMMEKEQVTWLDLGLTFRPYENTQATALFRFSQDWQTFFASRSRPVGVRWLSMDGQFNKAVSYNVGDFKQKYSPLTLWAPEIDFILEPKIFARDRAELEYEHFIGDNERVLQGANVNLSSGSIANMAEVRVDGFFSRIRRAEYLDQNGKQGKETGYYSDYENLAAGTQLEALVLDNILLGGGFVHNFDQEGTYLYDDQVDPSTSQNEQAPTYLLNTSVTSARGGVDIAGFIGLNFLTLEALGEYAMSSRSADLAIAQEQDPAGLEVAATQIPEDVNGSALWLELGAGYEQGDISVLSTSRFIQNTDNFINPLAQSTTFIGERVMNSANDDGQNTLYSTLDALYHGVSHYSPTLYEDANQSAPYEKNSFTNSVQYSDVNYDPAIQTTLPNGLATANRTGITTGLTADYLQGGVKTEVALKSLKSNNPINSTDGVSFNKTEEFTYQQLGGGLGLDVSKFLAGWEHPLELSAAYTRDESDKSQTTTDIAGTLLNTGDESKYTSELIQTGAYLKFHRLLAVLGGYQQLKSESLTYGVTDVSPEISAKRTESYWRAGMEFTIGKNAYFITSFGQLNVDIQNDLTSVSQLDPAQAATITKVSNTGDFSQFISQFKIRAEF